MVGRVRFREIDQHILPHVFRPFALHYRVRPEVAVRDFLAVSDLGLDPWEGFVYLKWFMNDELSKPTETITSRRPLEARLAHRPEVLARLHRLADMLDQSAGDDCTADQAEARVSAQVRQLALEVLAQWALEANAHTQAQVQEQHPAAIRHGKKKR
jgi:hypothetical protein